MPKEMIWSEAVPFTRDDQGNEVSTWQNEPRPGQPLYQRGVHVGWSRNRYVEVGAGVFSPSTEEGSEAHYLGLDRDGVNRLIRTLRKARDAAFGADA